MKKGFLLFLAIALTIIGVYVGYRERVKEVGEEKIDFPPAFSILKNIQDALPIKTESAKPEPSPKDLAQLETLNSILASRNDNDERMDKELKILSEAAKELLRKKYETIVAEARNQRGTIVFLLGRNLTQEKDFDFFRQVLEEAPCRSLDNCLEDPKPASGTHLHEEIGIDLTLDYPQIMALKMLERVLERGASDPVYRYAEEEVLRATKSRSEKVAQTAKEIEAKYLRLKP